MNHAYGVTLVPALLLCGCTALYRIEVPPSDRPDIPRATFGVCEGLQSFWLANGFQEEFPAFVFGAAQRRDVAQAATRSWVKAYPGWIFPQSGDVSAMEVSEGGKCIVYIYGVSRDREACEAAENLRQLLVLYYPLVDVRVDKTHFLDLR